MRAVVVANPASGAPQPIVGAAAARGGAVAAVGVAAVGVAGAPAGGGAVATYIP